MTEVKNILNPTSFYNDIAATYNSDMTEQDSRTRKIVCEQFLNLVSKGNVLDFGAGTGNDLLWLMGHKNYTVFALEPSTGMRDIAKAAVRQTGKDTKVRFIKANLDFQSWTKMQLPFPEKWMGYWQISPCLTI